MKGLNGVKTPALVCTVIGSALLLVGCANHTGSSSLHGGLITKSGATGSSGNKLVFTKQGPVEVTTGPSKPVRRPAAQELPVRMVTRPAARPVTRPTVRMAAVPAEPQPVVISQPVITSTAPAVEVVAITPTEAPAVTATVPSIVTSADEVATPPEVVAITSCNMGERLEGLTCARVDCVNPGDIWVNDACRPLAEVLEEVVSGIDCRPPSTVVNGVCVGG